MAVKSPNSIEHLSHHLPRLRGCPGCDEGKHLHKYRKRRRAPMVYVSGQDAIDAPFGAMMHIDWIEIKRNTQAFQAAQRALVCTDELTNFLGGFPVEFQN